MLACVHQLKLLIFDLGVCNGDEIRLCLESDQPQILCENEVSSNLYLFLAKFFFGKTLYLFLVTLSLVAKLIFFLS